MTRGKQLVEILSMVDAGASALSVFEASHFELNVHEVDFLLVGETSMDHPGVRVDNTVHGEAEALDGVLVHICFFFNLL